MTMQTTSHLAPSSNRSLLRGILARIAQVVLLLVAEMGILFAVSGRLTWTWAWVFLGIYLADIALNAPFMLGRHREVMAERGQAELTETWDKVLSLLWALAQFLLLPLVAALDVRLLWSGELALGWHLAGAVLFALGLGLFSWAMLTNAYFSTVVRIQSERGQTVCTSGPYRVVRHPGYAGAVLQSLGIPVLLGSWWALIPGLFAAAFISARAAFEDRLLQSSLPGYPEYARKVRYRLLPGIW